jgi:hypothetical protein
MKMIFQSEDMVIASLDWDCEERAIRDVQDSANGTNPGFRCNREAHVLAKSATARRKRAIEQGHVLGVQSDVY